MADLGQVLGTLLASLAHARRMADEQTTAIAEYYRNDALLQGLTVPRVRVPELIVELPVVLETVDEGVAPTPTKAAKVVSAALDEMMAAAKDLAVPDFAELTSKLEPELLSRVERLTKESSLPISREAVAHDVEQGFLQVLDVSGFGRRLDPKLRDAIAARIRKRVNDVAVKDPGRPPTIKVSVLTSEIKERADPNTVTRLRLVMREEGLEWQETKKRDGSTTARLGPE